MPQRHERARLGEQQEEDAVDDRERLFEGVVEYSREGEPDAAAPQAFAIGASA